MCENTEHQQLILEVESKMPKKILTEIFKKKNRPTMVFRKIIEIFR